MKRIAPGVYDDERGGIHIEIDEVLVANGYPDTPENRAMFTQVWREYAAAQGIPFHADDDPIH